MRIGFWKCSGNFRKPRRRTLLFDFKHYNKSSFLLLLQLKFFSSETLTLEMMGSEVPAKRPFCPSCSKPARVCLCSRIKTQLLDNSIAVTILQHNQEKKHPLNSTRIATLGLKNLTVATVSDVHFEAQFHMRLLKSDYRTALDDAEESMNNWKCVSSGNSDCCDSNSFQKPVFDSENRTSIEQESSFEQNVVDCLIAEKKQRHDFDSVSAPQMENEAESADNKAANTLQNRLKKPDFDQIEATPTPTPTPTEEEEEEEEEEAEVLITATVAKCGVTCSLTQLSTPENHLQNPNFDQLLDSQVGKDAVSNGFIVKKFQRKQKSESSMEFEELEEYEIVIPPGSALLFPTKNSISLESIDFEVKHLIVLDGTWRKAKRMYHENPWLKVLPHLKLDLNKASLYSEVRSQPKAGCLSTIESILFAMKALGDDQEGLNNLMDVFESMVGDQRRCKDENTTTNS